MDKKKDRAGTIMIIIGVVLIAACIGLFVWNLLDAERAREDMDERLNLVTRAIEERLKNPGESSDPGESSTSVSADQKNMPVVKLDGYEYIGRITIPSISIDLPVLAEWDDNRLWINPCRYTGNYKTDDMVICAHNLDSHFGGLLNIGIGEKVIFTAVDGKVYNYIISNRETVQPTSIDEMILNMNNAKEEGGLEDWDLTLFTCHLGGQTRCAVRCIRVDE